MKLILDGKDESSAIRAVRRIYRVGNAQVAADHTKIVSIIRDLDTTEDACPVWNLKVSDTDAFTNKITAPYRADLALNYDCNNKCMHCYVARAPGEKKPLSAPEWKKVMETLWNVGVPHICFTGGEATLSPDLVELIERAEDIGQIAGLLTNGRRLADRAYAKSLCAAGLDHVQITIESHDQAIHDAMVGAPGAFAETVEGIRNAVAEDIYLVTNTTLCRMNIAGIDKTIEFLGSLGVKQFAMNSFIQTGSAPSSGQGLAEDELEQTLARVGAKAQDLGMRFIWYTPTHYCEFNPASHGVGLKRCTAAEYNICIEPDGDVIPCQSYYQPAGNILKDPWEKIWNSELFVSMRTRSLVPNTCRQCPRFFACGGGCPLSKGDKFLCADSLSEM